MRHGMKLALAAGFVGAVSVAAAAFAQTPGTPSPDGQQRKPRAERSECGKGGPRLARAARRLVHSETKVQVREGGFAVVVVDTGTITAVDGSSVTIKRADGESVTATAGDQTKVCKDGKKVTVAQLSVGDRAGITRVTKDGETHVRAIRAHTPNADGAQSRPQRQRPAFAEDGLPDELSA